MKKHDKELTTAKKWLRRGIAFLTIAVLFFAVDSLFGYFVSQTFDLKSGIIKSCFVSLVATCLLPLFSN